MSEKIVHLLVSDRIGTLRWYEVTANYGISKRRRAEVEAEIPQRAAVEAVLRGLLPIEFIRGRPITFHPGIYQEGGRDRVERPQNWPNVVSVNENREGVAVIIGWGTEDTGGTLLLNVRPIEHLES